MRQADHSEVQVSPSAISEIISLKFAADSGLVPTAAAKKMPQKIQKKLSAVKP